MSDPLPVRITALAAQHIREAKAWWRANRTAAAQAIDQELQRAFTLIASQPSAGARATDVYYLAGTPAVLGNPTVIAGVGVTHLRYPVRKA